MPEVQIRIWAGDELIQEAAFDHDATLTFEGQDGLEYRVEVMLTVERKR